MKDLKLQPDVETGIPETECKLPILKVKLCQLQLKDELCQKKAR